MNTHENRAILVGILVNLGRGDKKEASYERRNTLGATITSFSLELITPFGDAFTLPLEVSAQTAGKELLTRTQIGHPLVVEGTIRRRVSIDRRMAVEDSDTGTRTVETQITVAQIRTAREDEPVGANAVWIEGKVLTPPRIGSHRLLRDMEMARTIVQITLKHPSSYPGSKAQITEQMEVQVALPTLGEGAETLYQPGNVVRIQGQLDMNRIPQANTLVQGKLDMLEQEWKVQRAALEASIVNSQERERQIISALRRYRNQRANMQEVSLLTVVAGYVELVQGKTLTEAQVTEATRAGVRAARTARLARVRYQPQNAGAKAAISDVLPGEPAAMTSDVQSGERASVVAPQSAKANQPRRRDDVRTVGAPTPEQAALRAVVVPPIRAIDVVGAVESVAIPAVESVSDVTDVRDAVVADVHPASVLVLDAPSDTQVMAPTPEQLPSEGRLRRRREPVLVSSSVEPVEV